MINSTNLNLENIIFSNKLKSNAKTLFITKILNNSFIDKKIYGTKLTFQIQNIQLKLNSNSDDSSLFDDDFSLFDTDLDKSDKYSGFDSKTLKN